MIKVGFTGTQEGTTPKQRKTLRELLSPIKEGEFHHGDCIGSDAEAHDIAEELKLITHSHPPRNESKRAFRKAKVTHKKLPYLTRNRAIVDLTDYLIATPAGPEKLMSGTWSTVRYAKSIGKIVWIVWPDGTYEQG